MNLLSSLNDALSSNTPTVLKARIVSVEGTNFRVSSKSGTFLVPSQGFVAGVGSIVRIESGVVVGLVQRSDNVPSFRV